MKIRHPRWFLILAIVCFLGAAYALFLLIYTFLGLKSAHADTQVTSKVKVDCKKRLLKAKRIMLKARSALALQEKRFQGILDAEKAEHKKTKHLCLVDKRKCNAQLQSLARSVRGPSVVPWVIAGILLVAAVGTTIWAIKERNTRIKMEASTQ